MSDSRTMRTGRHVRNRSLVNEIARPDLPCAGGISHNEREAAEPDHLEAGGNVLLQAVLAKAGVP